MSIQIDLRICRIIMLVGISLLMLLWNSSVRHTMAQTSFDCSAISDEMPQIECQALVAIYNATGGENWNYEGGNASDEGGDAWLETMYPCSWYGIRCENKHVISIELSSLSGGPNSSSIGLVGDFPPEVGNLTHLAWLWLGNNQLLRTLENSNLTVV